MAFVRTVPEEQSMGSLKEMYDAARIANGYVPNYTQALSIRPEIMAAARALAGAVRRGMDLRRYELITVSVAAHLRCSY